MHIMLCQGIPCQSVCTTEALILIEGLSWCSIILLVRVEIKARWCFATPIKLGEKRKREKKPNKTKPTSPKAQCILWLDVNICLLSCLKGREEDYDPDIQQ